MSDYLGPYLLGPNDENQGIYTGDARELAKAIPDESVDLIFADPVYDRIDDYRWLAETAARVLRPGTSCVAFSAHHLAIPNGAVMLESGLQPGPVLEHYIPASPGRLFAYSLQCNVIPALWFSRGYPSTRWMALQQSAPLPTDERGHVWGKNRLMIQYRIERLSELGQIVLDPFTGGGTVPAVCKMLGRRWLAFEIDPDVADRARERVRMTQPPLFVPEPEQLSLLGE